jgi:hypothetical protein
MKIAKAVDAIFSRQRGLSLARFGQPKVVKSEIGWQMRLIMPAKERTRSHHIRPFRESLAPPHIVFRDRVKLRQVKRNRPDSHPPPADSRLTSTAKNMLIKTWCMSTAIL